MSNEDKPQKQGMPLGEKLTIGAGALVAIGIMFMPQVYQITLCSAGIATGTFLLVRTINKAIKQKNHDDAVYYSAYPERRPEVIKAAEISRKKEKKEQIEKEKDERKTTDAIIKIAHVSPVTLRDERKPHYKDGPLILNRWTRSYQTPQRFAEWMENHKDEMK